MASLRSLRGMTAAACLATLAGCAVRPEVWSVVVPEQRQLDVRQVGQLPSVPLPLVPAPPTVSSPVEQVVAKDLSLDEAIRIALGNSQVVRVLAGVSAVSSGQTIYDPAISNTAIDEARAVFDPNLLVNNNWSRTEPPTAVFDPASPAGARITGTTTDQHELNVGLAKRTISGGTARLDYLDRFSRSRPGLFPLNPQDRSSLALSYTQPLLRGAGVDVNLAPIVIARINTERSYFQLKDAVQELTRGVVEAYWAVVFAKTDVWARRQQVEQGKEAFTVADARLRKGLGTLGAAAQTKVALANFQAGLIAAEANLLQREAALRNILGLPPSDGVSLVLTTRPTSIGVEPRWDEMVALAEDQRPDLIELKLILEADEQTLLQANNQARPQVDLATFYQWNGLEGVTPTRDRISSGPGQFTDWTLGVNFSVPLGLRQARAQLRRAELVILRDKANLEQGLHRTIHVLAGNLRDLAQYYEQYRAFQEVRAAARVNLDQQLAEFKAGRTIYLNVLQAISDWGNAVSAEAQSLALYNTELASLERETGTILETHGVRFMEERYRSIGPLGRHGPRRCYPRSVVPGPNADRYPPGQGPAENAFDLQRPGDPSTAPRPEIAPPTSPLPPPRPMLLPPDDGQL